MKTKLQTIDEALELLESYGCFDKLTDSEKRTVKMYLNRIHNDALWYFEKKISEIGREIKSNKL